MANKEHLAMLTRGVAAWNSWRAENPDTRPDLSPADLSGFNLSGANLSGANLSRAHLTVTDLSGADLSGADFADVRLFDTNLTNVDLSSFVNVPVTHRSRSVIDDRSIARSFHCENLLPFLVATGMPHIFATYAIDSLRSLDPNGLFNLMHSTFISYGGPDEPIAERLQKTLEENGVRTFLFSKHAKWGESLDKVMRAGIEKHDRVILVCTEASLVREGVLNEIKLTLERESAEGGVRLLIPVALDRYVWDEWDPDDETLKTAIRRRVIGDFQGADTDQSKFDQGIARLLEALKVSP